MCGSAAEQPRRKIRTRYIDVEVGHHVYIPPNIHIKHFETYGVSTMAKHFDYTTYHVTFLDDTFGLKTLTFNNKECAQDFANDLVFKQCEFVHLYQSQVSTIYLKDESVLYVQNFK